MQDDQENQPSRGVKWTKVAGIATTVFFVVKGLIWLGIIAAGAYLSFGD